MIKIIALIICLMLGCGNSLTSTVIECNYKTESYYVLGNIYLCSVNNNPAITTKESSQINSIIGVHQDSKTNDDLIGFYAASKTFEYFPQGLLNFFKNLKAIYFSNCKLKEIYQEDLKPFTKLAWLYIISSEIKVLEEGLFDFNPDLEVLGIQSTKIIHIDPNVFDRLTKLRYFWFYTVPCVKSAHVYDSKEKIQTAIKNVKNYCTASEFLSLDNQIKNLEIESKTLNTEEFNAKLENFEKTLNNSKFSKFRPLKGKFENLKSQNFVTPATERPDLKPNLVEISNCCQVDQISKLGTKLVGLSDNLNLLMTDGLNNMSSKVNDLKPSQCGTKNHFIELKASQNNFKTFFDEQKSLQNEVKSTLSKVESKLNDHGAELSGIKSLQKDTMLAVDGVKKSQLELQKSQSDTKNALNDLKLAQQTLKASHDTLSSSQHILVDSLSNLTTKFNELKSSQEDSRILQYDVKGSISDVESTLSSLQTSQNEVKISLSKLKTTQNDMKISLDKVNMNSNCDSEDKTGENFGGKLETLEGHYVEFTEKFDKIEKEIANSRHKISINFDERIKESEKRMMKKFEEVLEEKLGKILDEKLANLINTRSGTE